MLRPPLAVRHHLYHLQPNPQVNAMVKHHQAFEGRRFRGSLEMLQWMVDITVHSTSAMINGNGGEGTFGQLRGFGNWPHNP